MGIGLRGRSISIPLLRMTPYAVMIKVIMSYAMVLLFSVEVHGVIPDNEQGRLVYGIISLVEAVSFILLVYFLRGVKDLSHWFGWSIWCFAGSVGCFCIVLLLGAEIVYLYGSGDISIASSIEMLDFTINTAGRLLSALAIMIMMLGFYEALEKIGSQKLAAITKRTSVIYILLNILRYIITVVVRLSGSETIIYAECFFNIVSSVIETLILIIIFKATYHIIRVKTGGELVDFRNRM